MERIKNVSDFSKTLFAFYDLAVSPISFDFVSFIICAEQARVAANARSIHFVIVPFEDAGGHHDNEQFDSIHGDWRLRNVVVPLCNLLPATQEITLCSTRDYAHQIYDLFASHIFPKNYTVANPVERHHTGWSIIAAHRGQNVQCLKASDQARTYARQWIDQHAEGKKSVAITLREAPFGKNRNSDIKEWASFSGLLVDNGYYPILLRDIDTALDSTPDEFKDISVFPEGVFNLELRMGLYEECNYCAFVANGPAQVCWYNPNIHFLYQVTGDWLENHPTPFNRIGIDFDETPPVANFFQRWIWKEQSAENLFDELTKLDSDLTRSMEDGSHASKLRPISENKIPLVQLSERYLNWASRTFFTSLEELSLSQECVNSRTQHYMEDKERLLYLFNAALQAKDLEKAAQYLILAEDKLGVSGDLHVQMAVLNEAQENWEVAMKCYLSAIELGKKDVSIFFRLANTYSALNRLEDAQEIYETIIQKGGKSIKVTIELGKIYEKTKSVEFARQFYADAINMGIVDDIISERVTALS